MKKKFTKIIIALFALGLANISMAQCPTITITPTSATLACGVLPPTFTANTTPSVNVSYAWLQPGGSTPLLSQYCTPGAAGIHTFVATNNIGGCTTTGTVQVYSTGCLPSLTVVPVGNSFTVTCVKCVTMQANAVLSGTCGANVYVIWTNPAGTSTLVASNTLSTCIPGNNYRVFAVNMAAPTCTIAQLVGVSMNTTVPTSSVSSSPSVICVGQTGTLTASGSVSTSNFTWSTGAVSNSIVITPTAVANYSATTTHTASGCTSTVVYSVTTCAGISELFNGNSEFGLFPNPNNGAFTFQINKAIENAEIQILNNLGQLVYRKNVIEGNNSIKLTNLSKGIYHYVLLQNTIAVSKGKLIIE